MSPLPPPCSSPAGGRGRRAFATDPRGWARVRAERAGGKKKNGGADPRFPLLVQHYFHLSPAELRSRQVEALVRFNPEITLPKYTPWQFKHCLGSDGHTYA